MSTTLLWFTNDLRLHDNPALVEVVNINQSLICLFCINPQWFKTNQYNTRAMGNRRWRFLSESLANLDKHLKSKGQKLIIAYGEPSEVITQLINNYSVNTVIRSQHSGFYENQQWRNIRENYPKLSLKTAHTFTLFTPEIVFSTERGTSSDFPTTFSSFRKQVEQITVAQTTPIPKELPPALKVELFGHKLPDHKKIGQSGNEKAHLFNGGETNGLVHLKRYFSENLASSYKRTRNELDDWDSSCKFSPWLANGSLSVRQIVSELKNYEAKNGENDSTYWIYFELLWREYFQWYALHYGKQIFLFKGINNKKPLTTFYPQRFKQWCLGQTPWPIVNACMIQMNQTGYMSNRGRQLVASCLIYDLGLDWRCGAAYFEQQLLDYDVANNWGNWQYIAGVGADPRGGRHFNLEKQTQQYDPKGIFIKHWNKTNNAQRTGNAIDSVDAADWPISE